MIKVYLESEPNCIIGSIAIFVIRYVFSEGNLNSCSKNLVYKDERLSLGAVIFTKPNKSLLHSTELEIFYEDQVVELRQNTLTNNGLNVASEESTVPDNMYKVPPEPVSAPLSVRNEAV